MSGTHAMNITSDPSAVAAAAEAYVPPSGERLPNAEVLRLAFDVLERGERARHPVFEAAYPALYKMCRDADTAERRDAVRQFVPIMLQQLSRIDAGEDAEEVTGAVKVALGKRYIEPVLNKLEEDRLRKEAEEGVGPASAGPAAPAAVKKKKNKK